MQDNFNSVQTQPFVKLARANMDLFTRFSSSPEVITQATVHASQLFLLASESAMRLLQSGSFANMWQGMVKNYFGFISDLGQSSMGMLDQGRDVITDHAQEATDADIEAPETRSRRARQAA